MRTFYLNRIEDASGISGTGRVADGVQFDDGTCVLRWRTATRSTTIYDSIDHIHRVNGHNGKTQVVWEDQERQVEAQKPHLRLGYEGEGAEGWAMMEGCGPALPGLRHKYDALKKFVIPKGWSLNVNWSQAGEIIITATSPRFNLRTTIRKREDQERFVTTFDELTAQVLLTEKGTLEPIPATRFNNNSGELYDDYLEVDGVRAQAHKETWSQ